MRLTNYFKFDKFTTLVFKILGKCKWEYNIFNLPMDHEVKTSCGHVSNCVGVPHPNPARCQFWFL